MASIYRKKNSPYWYLQSNLNGQKQNRSLKLRVGVKAETRRAQQIAAETSAQELASSGRLAGSAFDAWVPQWIHAHFMNALTRRRVETCWSALSAFLNEAKVSLPTQVTRQHCQNYFAWRTRSVRARDGAPSRKARHHNTAVLEMKYLAQILNEARARGLITSNPAERLGIGRVPAKEKEAFTDAEWSLVSEELKTMPEWMQDAFQIASYHGVRLRETMVPMTDVHLDSNLIVFSRTKGNKPFGAVIHPAIRPLLERRAAQGCKFTCDLPKYPAKLFHQFFKRLGLRKSFHCTRVTVITQMAINGVDERIAKLYVNHSSSAVHAVYTKLRPEHAAKVADAIHYGR